MEYGDCSENVLSYFYRAETSACEAFYYSGCGGNGNRFETEEQCERQCGSYKGVGKLNVFSNKKFSRSFLCGKEECDVDFRVAPFRCVCF